MAKTIKLHNHNYTVMTPAQAKDVYRRYSNSDNYYLWHVYGSFSQAKANAYEYCRSRQAEFNGHNGRIVSHCIMQFTYAFTGFYEGEEYLVYITKDHDYAIKMDALQ